MSILHVKSVDAATITDALLTFLRDNDLDFSKLVGQGYDGASVFSGHVNGVQKRLRLHSCHAIYIHCACHRLQLASLQAADAVTSVKKVFGAMSNLWKLFHYSPKKTETLVAVQAALNLPELKVVKPIDTRWLSHEKCIRAILKELPAIITTLYQLYENSGDAEAYGLALIFSSFSGVATVILLSEVLDLLARLNCFMQRRAADFSALQRMIENVTQELKLLKRSGAEWCSEVTSVVENLEKQYEIPVGHLRTRKGSAMAYDSVKEFRANVAVPYLDALLDNIESQFSDDVVKLLVSSSVFNPALLPIDEALLAEYGTTELESLAQFYGSEAEVIYDDS